MGDDDGGGGAGGVHDAGDVVDSNACVALTSVAMQHQAVAVVIQDHAANYSLSLHPKMIRKIPHFAMMAAKVSRCHRHHSCHINYYRERY